MPKLKIGPLHGWSAEQVGTSFQCEVSLVSKSMPPGILFSTMPVGTGLLWYACSSIPKSSRDRKRFAFRAMTYFARRWPVGLVIMLALVLLVR